MSAAEYVTGREGAASCASVRVDVRLLQGFVVTMPFLHALSIGPWLPLPLLYVILIIAVYALTSDALRTMHFERDDLLVVATVVFGIFGYARNWALAGDKNFHHTVALCATLFCFFFWMRSWLSVAHINLKQVGSAATVALIIASVAVQLDFTLANTSGRYLSDLIPYSTEDLPVANVLGDFIRPRGLAAEPGFTAMVFEALAPLAWLFLRSQPRITRWASWLVILPGFVLLFSAGALTGIVLTAIIMLATSGSHRRRIVLLVAAALLVLVPLLMWSEIGSWVFDQIIGRKIVGLFVDTESGTATAATRYEALHAGWEIFTAKPLGIGWGMVSQMYSTGARIDGLPTLSSRGLISLYAEITVSAGLFGLITYLLFHLRKIVRLARLRTRGARAVLFALLAVSIHHAFVLEFWFPMLWFLLALANVLVRQEPSALAPAPPRHPRRVESRNPTNAL